MTTMNIRKNTRRAFGCRPSRIGVLFLLVLTVSCGMQLYGDAPSGSKASAEKTPAAAVAAVD